mmetsp:Transcript_42262/g.78291  ORF Transcript_42262/g.78291 Transcript_42262/m.78291 type:complete len:398 (+) Transcript_42262:60-1253(+)
MRSFFGLLFLADPNLAFTPFRKTTGRRNALFLSPASAVPSSLDDPWDLFATYHSGAWRGIWETFDQIGDSLDTQEVLFDAALSPDGESAALAQTMVVSSKQAACETCFDSQETKTTPLGTVGRGKLARSTLVGPALVTGPIVLRSGVMSTEVALRYPSGDGRVRVTLQHAPAWARDNPDGPGNDGSPPTGPPDALDLLRVVVRREALRVDMPNQANEQAAGEMEGATVCPRFWRGVPPYKWGERDQGAWVGTTHSWSSGSREEGAEGGGGGGGAHGAGAQSVSGRELDFDAPSDVWHERFTGDDENTWYLRLGGGVLIQTPQRLFSSYGGGEGDEADPCYEMRLAWLAEDDALVRCCVEITALETAVDEAGAVVVAPPCLKAVTVDAFKKSGVVGPA